MPKKVRLDAAIVIVAECFGVASLIVSNPHALRVGLTHFRSLSRLPNACMKVLILTQISRFQESLAILKNSLQLLDRTTGENVNND